MESTQVDAVGTEIRPFEVDVPQADLDELRRRIQATRWPEKETGRRSVAGGAVGDDAGARATGAPSTTSGGSRPG
jgi:hypothetical protein